MSEHHKFFIWLGVLLVGWLVNLVISHFLFKSEESTDVENPLGLVCLIPWGVPAVFLLAGLIASGVWIGSKFGWCDFPGKPW